MLSNHEIRPNIMRTLRMTLPAITLLAIAVWALAASGGASCGGFLASVAQAFGAAQTPCNATTLPINTGYNHTTGTTHAIGQADSNWQIVAPDPGGGVTPRPAGVITKHPAWKDALPNSQWITSYPTATSNLNADYWLEFTFCLQPGFTNAKLDLMLRADDEAHLYLNGTGTNNFIGSSLGSFGLATPTQITWNTQPSFVVGKNTLYVKLRNTGAVAMGLNLAGTITANGLGGAGLLTAECCNRTGRILGAKWNDLDGDGIWDSNETGIPGWQINLSNGQTAFTDNAGYYAFTNLAPGTYTVSETQKTCWQQTFPAGNGTHTINILPNQAYIANFGNRNTQKADFTATTVCLGSPTQFTDLSGCASSWNWSFGSSVKNPVYTFTSAGTHAVTLCINNNASCVTRNVTVLVPPPSPVITGPNTACDKTATYTVANAVSGVVYQWTITGGSPATATGNSVTITWNSAGPYIIEVATPVTPANPCPTRARIVIQPCGEPDRCCNFRVATELKREDFVEKSNGMYTVSPKLTASASITEVTATLISAWRTTSASVNPSSCGTGGPLDSYIIGVGPAPSTSFNTGTLPVNYSREVEWKSTTSLGAPVSGLKFPFDIQFPQAPSYPCNDVLRFCVKYTFKSIINGVCYTCERIECYSFGRRGSFPTIQQPPGNVASLNAEAQSAAETTVGEAGEQTISRPGRSTLAGRERQAEPERALRGPIWTKWFSLGGAESFLGQPVTGELPIPNFSGEGNLARFQGGSIYFTPETGAVAIPDLAGSVFSTRDYAELKGAAEGGLDDPFVRLKAGRLSYVVAVGDGEYVLGDSATQRVVLILFDPRRGPGEYFIVENRFRPDEPDNLASGVAVWHVVEDLGLFKRVELQAEALGEFGEHGLRLLRHVSGRQTALLQAGEVLTSESLPPLRWLDGSPANFEIRLLSAPGANVRLAVTIRR